MTMNGNVDMYFNIYVSVGDNSGKTDVLDLQGGTLTLMQNSANNSFPASPNSNAIAVGTGGILKFDGAIGEQTVAAKNDADGVNDAFIDISGGVMTVQARGTSSSTTTTVPIKMDDGVRGLLDVESHNGLSINAAGTTLPFALDVGGTDRAQLGLQNPGDTGPGAAGIACVCGSAEIDPGGELRVLGASNTFSTSCAASNNLNVLGQLTLDLPGSGATWVPSKLTITSGDITFGASSTFSLWGRKDSTDYDTLTVTSGNVWITNGASLGLNVWGKSTKSPSWTGVITDTAGGGNGIFSLGGGTGFNNPAGWTNDYVGGPPPRIDVSYTG